MRGWRTSRARPSSSGSTSNGACKDVDHYISDSGLKYLKQFGDLEYLNLDWNNVTDAGLEQLKGLSSLREVILGSGRYTPTGVKELRQALPKAKIAP